MKNGRFSDAQIMAVLKQAEGGTPVSELCREQGMGHHVRSGEDLETTLHRYVGLYNHPLAQSALGCKTPLHAMKQWHKRKPGLFTKKTILPHGM